MGAVMSDQVVATPILRLRNVTKEFTVRGGIIARTTARVQAVSDVSLDILGGQTLGIVGESGCGKSTLGRTMLQLVKPTAGSIQFNGEELVGKSPRALRKIRPNLQMVFQDPYSSLNPRMTVGSILAEPLRYHRGLSGADARKRVAELLDLVQMSPEHANRYPHEFSGGQRQRVGIARAISLEPSVVVLDEPVSALDMSIQAGIVNLLDELQQELGLTYVFIAHDLAVVRHLSDHVAVMYLGRIVEEGPQEVVYANPRHPYTKALLSAVPTPDPKRERERKRIILVGEVPSPINPPSGCRFRTRCWKATDKCAIETPVLEYGVADEATFHKVACFYPE